MFRRIQHSLLSVQYFLIYAWAVLRHVLMHVLLLLVAYFLLTGGPQIEDIFRSLNASEPNLLTNRPFRIATLYSLLWGMSIWFCGRVLLTLADIRGPKLLNSFKRFPQQESERERERLSVFIRRVPRLLGVMPPVLVSLACLNAENTRPFYVFWFLLLAYGLALWFLHHRFVLRRLVPGIRFDPHLYVPNRRNWQHVWLNSNQSVRLIYTFLIGYWFYWFVLIFWSSDWRIYQTIGPLGVLLIGFVWFTPLVSLLTYWNSPTRPVLLLTLLWIIFCSFFNDHTLLRFTDTKPSSLVAKRPGLNEHFNRWINVRQDWPSDTMPIFLIAAEGGGIRSLNWTAGTLHKLDSLYPRFREQTFAISGVSGGGVGVALYETFKTGSFPTAKAPDAPQRAQLLRRTLGEDFLSPILGALFFHESLQRMVPFAIQQLNRSNWLEDAWSLSFDRHLRQNALEKPFLDLFQRDPLHTPSLLLNSVLTENGQKCILSNLRIDSTFRDVVDIYGITQRDMPIKTAASLTARFPWVTGGGLLTRPNGEAFGHVVDGGYWDNTGLETTLSVLTAITPVIQEFNRQARRPFQIVPVVIYLQNSLHEDGPRVSDTFIDVLMPLEASINANQRKSSYVSSLTRNILQNFTPSVPFYTLSLDRHSGVPLPLGWYLSDDAQRDLWRKIDAMPAERANTLQAIGRYF